MEVEDGGVAAATFVWDCRIMLGVTHPKRLAQREARRPLWMDAWMDGWRDAWRDVWMHV